MSYALLGLVYSSFSSLFLLLGVGTAINKTGDFFKILENENDDNFKKAFDKLVGDLSDDFNNSFESINLISQNVSKIWILFWELLIGEKFIKKTKDGKIVVDDKNVIFDNYESKINNLNNKIQNYREILKKSNVDIEDSESESDSDSDSDNNEEIEEVNVD